jgi:hypothetical protein
LDSIAFPQTPHLTGLPVIEDYDFDICEFYINELCCVERMIVETV